MWGRRKDRTEATLAERRRRAEAWRARALAIARLVLPDLRDAVFVVGLALLGYGLWLERPAAAFIACGAILVAVALRRAPAAGADVQKGSK